MTKHLSRRQFLQLIPWLAMSAALGQRALAPGSQQDEALHQAGGQHYPVIIAGAGVAGLAAARELLDHGIQPLVLEARPRPGGRIWTWRDEHGLVVELGSERLLEGRSEPLFARLLEQGLQAVPAPLQDHRLYAAGGAALDPSSLQEARLLLARLLRQAASQQQAPFSALDLGQALEPAYARLEIAPQSRALLSHLLRLEVEQTWGADAANLSPEPLPQSLQPQPAALLPAGLDQLAAVLAQGLNLHLGEPVTQISFDTTPVRVTTPLRSYTCDQVLVSVPLGVLRQRSIRFTPELPEWKLQSIRQVGIGVQNKVYLRFERAYWPQVGSFGQFGPGAGAWTKFEPLSGAPVLLAHAAGAFAFHLEQLDDEQVVASALQALRSLFGARTLPPRDWRITRWMSDPFALGSSSFLPPGSGSSVRQALAQPLGKRVFFAGEAAAVQHPASINGAYQSGRETALNILATRSSIERLAV